MIGLKTDDFDQPNGKYYSLTKITILNVHSFISIHRINIFLPAICRRHLELA